VASSLDARAFNIGTSRETTVNRLAEVLQEVAGRHVGVRQAPERPGELRYSCLATDRARAVNWKAETDIREGLERTYRYIAEAEERID